MDETVGMVMEKVEGIKGTVGEIKEKVFFFQNKTARLPSIYPEIKPLFVVLFLKMLQVDSVVPIGGMKEE